MSGLVRVKDCIEGIEFKQIEPSLKALAILLGLFSLFHVPELTNFTLSIDDEYAAFRDQPEVWITQGRWVAYLFERFVMPMPVVPFLPLALFGFFCSIGYLFFLRAIGERYATPLSFAFFPLFSSFPIWAHLTAFQSNTPSAALGVLLSCAAASLYRKEREQPEGIGRGFSLITHIALIGFLGAAATACYQSFILFLGVALLASLISMHLSNRPARLLLKDFLLVLAILAISIILYMLILKFCLFITNVKVEYIQGFLRPEILFNRPGRVLSDLFRKLGNVYFGHSTVYGINARSFAVIFFLAAAGIVNRAYSVAGLRGVFLAILSILALMFVPFGINLMSGGIMPLRSLVAVPVAFAGLGLLGFKYAPAWLSRVGILALLLAYFAIFQISSGFNAARQLVQVHDHEMAGAISERIAQVVGHANPGKRIFFESFGEQSFKAPFPRIEGSTIGASFFEWERGSPYRIIAYMKLIGLPVLRGVPKENLTHQLLDEFVLMPPWPAQDSVRAAANGMILLKLSDVPGERYEKLLTSKDSSADPNSEPFYRLSSASADSWSVQAVSSARKTAEGLVLETGTDSNLTFRVGAPQVLRDSSRIEIHARLKIKQACGAQMFYTCRGQSASKLSTAIGGPISPAADGGYIDVNLQAICRDGFEDSFRWNMVGPAQHETIGELELFSRHQRPAQQKDEKPEGPPHQ